MEATERHTIDEISTALALPFPESAHKSRAVQGKGFTYVEGFTVIRRLNESTNNHWDFRIIKIDSKEVAIPARNGKDARIDLLMMATVELSIPGLGTRQHVGVQMVSPGSGEDLVKGCVTDALKKAATLFGVGLELYGPDYESENYEQQRADPVMHQRSSQPPQTRQISNGHAPEPTPMRRPAPAANGQRTWNEFWPYARTKGLNNQADVERAFDHAIGTDAHAAYLELQEISGDK